MDQFGIQDKLDLIFYFFNDTLKPVLIIISCKFKKSFRLSSSLIILTLLTAICIIDLLVFCKTNDSNTSFFPTGI